MFLKKLCGYIAITLCATIILTSCSGSQSNSPANQQSSQNAANSKADYSLRTLRIAVNTEIDSFDPYISAAADTQGIMMNVFEGLTMTDSAGNIIPALAKKWELSDDGKAYTFYLEENVTFHNGEKFSADDVVFSLKRLSGLDGGKAASSKFEDVAAVEKISDYSVKVTLNKSDASFLGKCMTPVIPEGYTEQAEKPVGTGPYKFAAFQPGQLTRLVLNTDYYNKDKMGKINTVEFVLMPDDSAKIMALRSGSVDLFEASGETISQLNDNDFTKFHSYSNLAQILALNNEAAPFDDPKVRAAINYALNRQEIVDIATGGSGCPIYTSFTPSMAAWYNASTEKTYAFNQGKAKELLKEAGFENGFEMEITVPSNYKIHVDSAQVIVSQLEKVGIKAVIKQIEMAQWTSEVYTDANYHATIIGLGGKIEPHDIIVRFESSYYRNFYNFTNAEYDKIVAEGLLESNIAKRKALYNKAQQIITDESAAIFIQDPGRDIACLKEVKGYISYPIIYWDLVNMYFE